MLLEWGLKPLIAVMGSEQRSVNGKVWDNREWWGLWHIGEHRSHPKGQVLWSSNLCSHRKWSFSLAISYLSRKAKKWFLYEITCWYLIPVKTQKMLCWPNRACLHMDFWLPLHFLRFDEKHLCSTPRRDLISTFDISISKLFNLEQIA